MNLIRMRAKNQSEPIGWVHHCPLCRLLRQLGFIALVVFPLALCHHHCHLRSSFWSQVGTVGEWGALLSVPKLMKFCKFCKPYETAVDHTSTVLRSVLFQNCVSPKIPSPTQKPKVRQPTGRLVFSFKKIDAYLPKICNIFSQNEGRRGYQTPK